MAIVSHYYSVVRGMVMALIIRSKKVEYLARLLANRTGSTVTDAIEEALRVRLGALGALGALAALGALPDQVITRLQAIAKTCAAAPDLDTRPVDEVLGYNVEGIFRVVK